MRKYEPIWNKLKRDKVVSITAHRALHDRIYKAVVKEKWKDIVFKLETEPRAAILFHERTHSIIIFKLKFFLRGLTVEDI